MAVYLVCELKWTSPTSGHVDPLAPLRLQIPGCVRILWMCLDLGCRERPNGQVSKSSRGVVHHATLTPYFVSACSRSFPHALMYQRCSGGFSPYHEGVVATMSFCP